MWYAADQNVTITAGKVSAIQEITGRSFAQLLNPNDITPWGKVSVTTPDASTIKDTLDASIVGHCIVGTLFGLLINVPCVVTFECLAGTLGFTNVGFSGGQPYGCDIANGTTLLAGGSSVLLGDGWRRFTLPISNPASNTFLICINNAYTNALNYRGDGTGTIQVRNSQISQKGQLIQNTSANRGPLKTDARYGGRTVLDMTGSVYMTGNPPGRDQPYTYYLVGNVLDTTTLHCLLGSTSGVVSFRQLSANGGVSLSAGTALTAAGNASTPGIYVASTNGASSAVYLRSLAAGASGNAGAGALKTGALYLGSSATPDSYNGDTWAELIGCRSANINPSIMRYLSRKYALPLS
jgi:hypothetical protein